MEQQLSSAVNEGGRGGGRGATVQQCWWVRVGMEQQFSSACCG